MLDLNLFKTEYTEYKELLYYSKTSDTSSIKLLQYSIKFFVRIFV